MLKYRHILNCLFLVVGLSFFMSRPASASICVYQIAANRYQTEYAMNPPCQAGSLVALSEQEYADYASVQGIDSETVLLVWSWGFGTVLFMWSIGYAIGVGKKVISEL